MEGQLEFNDKFRSATIAENRFFDLSEQNVLQQICFKKSTLDANKRTLFELLEMSPLIKSLMLDHPELERDVIKNICFSGLEIDDKLLHSNMIGDIVMKSLGSTEGNKFRRLILEDSGITETGISYLLNGKNNFDNMIQISFANNRLNTNAIKSLIRFKWFQIKKIDLSINFINDKGAEILGKAKWPFLEQFKLDCNKIGIEGLRHLVKNNFTKMKKISLSFNRLSAKMAQELIKTEWPCLTDLNLQCNMEECEPILTPRGPWIWLKWINLEGNFIKEFEIEKMMAEYLNEEMENEDESEEVRLKISERTNDEEEEMLEQMIDEKDFENQEILFGGRNQNEIEEET